MAAQSAASRRISPQNTGDVTRNARVTTKPGSIGEGATRTRKSTDEIFNESYAQAGVQPTSILDRPAANDPYYKQAEVVPIRRPQTEYYPEAVAPTRVAKAKRKKKKKKPSLLKRGVAKLGVTGVNTVIFTAGLFLWSFFQVPVALINIVSFGLLAAIDAALAAAAQSSADPDAGLFSSILSGTVNLVGKAFSALNDLVYSVLEIDIGAILGTAITAPFVITHLLLVAFGTLMLMTMYLVYKVAFIDPIGGRGTNLKMGCFLLAFIGYMVPVLNIFPWFIVWAAAVWIYPK